MTCESAAFQPIEDSGLQDLRYNRPLAMDDQRGEVTVLLEQLRNGEVEAESRLLSLVYAELKQRARARLRRERSDLTLGASDLVHEAYLRIAGDSWQNRAHFFAVAAMAMRRILVDHARARRAYKRGEGKEKLSFDEASFAADVNWEYLPEIDLALRKLAAVDPRKARVVELRFFADLSVEETAEVLGCCSRTVRREWRFARAWLRVELSKGTDSCLPNDGEE